MTNILLAIASLFLIATGAHAQSRIVTTSGSVFVGEILDEDKTQVALMTIDGIEVKIPRAKIESISYDRSQGVPEESPTEMIRSQLRSAGPVEDDRRVSAGISLGNHGDAGLNIGYQADGYIARATGIGWDDHALLVQASLMKELVRTGPLSLSAGLISGYMWFSGDYSYRGIPTSDLFAGPAASLSVLGMYTEIGYTYGFGQREGAYLLYQVGYSYQF